MIAARRVFNKLRQLAPYALIELLLPGGTLLALGLWLYRRRKFRRGTSGQPGRQLLNPSSVPWMKVRGSPTIWYS